MKERTVERGRGCYNCKHWENGELTRNHWQKCKLDEQLRRGLVTQSVLAERSSADDPFTSWDKAITSGSIGMCLVGGVDTDFVANLYLCPRWSGRQGSSVATAGQKLDLLPEELAVRVEEKAKKV